MESNVNFALLCSTKRSPLQETAVPSCWTQTSLSRLPCWFLLALVCAVPVSAQDSIPFDSLLFEPHPMPEDAAGMALDAVGWIVDTPEVPYLIPAETAAISESAIDLYLENITATEVDDGPFA